LEIVCGLLGRDVPAGCSDSQNFQARVKQCNSKGYGIIDSWVYINNYFFCHDGMVAFYVEYGNMTLLA
jgi:hypothetical protein